MVKYREIIRLSAMGISVRSIAESVRCAPSTVQSVQRRAKANSVYWPLPDEMNDDALKALLYPPQKRNRQNKAEPDYVYIKEELTKCARYADFPITR